MAILKVLGVAALAAVSLSTAAQAADGCGRGFHRGPYGHCRPNGGPGFVGPGPVVVVPSAGVFYEGRGWWDGHRYYQNRERWHGGWRYR